ncbi:Uncharacterized protein BP5553_02595 [Venustampulla echinocandica]|uniref:Xylanolytic transcriptional activator regulatory domain-containing protein n=1 Tax=Venustampulla echinocandica TaxID=2656787 RepID=A0A370TRU8_9HELO|nr:Uncharacterized protein BP5553_02595 [Venustampulla echinocandica]RDL38255.1 Uncharacterized protein BP5553_02595 [Venustampulla echinocandica]
MVEPERRRRRPTVNTAPARSAGDARSDAIEKLPAAIAYGLETIFAFMRFILNLRGIILARAKQLALAWPKVPENHYLLTELPAQAEGRQSRAIQFESMKSRIKHLEEQLSKTTLEPIQSPVSTTNTTIETSTSDMGGTFSIHRESRLLGQPPTITRSVTHKKRMFGQSHWFNGVVLIFEPYLRDGSMKACSGVQKCKSLARVIKSQRAPSWPSPITTELPPKNVADELVDCYLRTTETVYRVLHVPTFKRDYGALWLSDTEPDTAFLIQLKLVLAIGASTYDEQFSLRVSAVRWVYEAQTWLLEPKFKSRLGIQPLQINLLLLLARETAGVGEEFIWISAGELLRRAVYMGFHRDPAHLPKRTTFAAEMRRRLWNTILEVTLQSSLTSGGPPLISLDDFDTEPPGNFDDDQLMAEGPVPKPEGDFTQVSIAISLRKMFPVRLAITKFLNDFRSQGTYEETLRLDSELRASYKAICQTLQGCSSSTGPSPSRFEIGVVDFLVHRYRSSLHVPFFGLALHETAYAFSRKVVVETSLKIWYAACPSSSTTVAQPRSDTASPDQDDLARLTVCGSGFYRTVAAQATLLIGLELRTQLQEEESLGPVPLRPDLLSVLEDAKTWCLRCIKAGETNIKGYLITCIIATQIEGLMRGLGKDEIFGLIVKAVDDAEKICLPVLEEMAAQGQAEEPVEGPHQISSNASPEAMESWDFLMSDALFNTNNAEPMSWMFNDENIQTQALW